MSLQIQLRHDLAANWTSANPVLAQGETGIETDTNKFKFGDGVTAWASLAYAGGGGGGGSGTVTSISGDGVVTAGTITTAGSLTLANAAANTVLGNGTGSPAHPTYLTTLPAVSGVNLTAINASNISSGTIGSARLPVATSSSFGAVEVDNATIIATAGVISVSAIPASAVTSGTIATARLGSGSATSSTFLRGDNTWVAVGGGSGTVTSVAMTGDGVVFNATVTGSPVTTTGTLVPALLTQTANTVLAGPTTGAAANPTFRALVAADIPSLSTVYVPVGRTISTTSPLLGGGDLSANRTFSLAGLGGLGTANQVVGMNNAATAYEYKTVAGTTNQITATQSAGAITLSTPQNIDIGASVTFSALNLSSLTASRAVVTDASKNLISSATTLAELAFVSGVTSAIQTQLNSKGTGNGTVTSVTYTGDGVLQSSTPSSAVTASGTLTATLLTQTANFILSGPVTGAATTPTFRAMVTADLGTTLTPTFANITDSGLTASTILLANGSKVITSSASLVTDTELGYVHGVTSSIQTQINAKGAGTVTSISGDGTVTNGTITGTGSLGLANAAANSVLGNGTGSPAAPAYLTTLPAMSGANLTTLTATNLSSGTVPTARLGSGAASSSTFLRGDQTWAAAGGGSGTVTSVTFTGDGTVLSSTPSSAVTTTGTVTATLNTQSANLIFSGPSSGSAATPTFRAMVNADMGTTLTPQYSRLGLGQASDGTIPLAITVTAIGATTAVAGLWVQNTTAAAAGAQQESPAVRWTGQGWKTTATAASQQVDFIAYVLPVQGSTNPTSEWHLDSSVNSGAYTNRFKIDTSGNTTVGGTFNSGNNITAGNQGFLGPAVTLSQSSNGPTQMLIIQQAGGNSASDCGYLSFNTRLVASPFTTYEACRIMPVNEDDHTTAAKDAEALSFYTILANSLTETFRMSADGTFKATSGIKTPFTLTTAGNTGPKTINQPVGSIRIAAAGTSVVLTNSLITANSVVFPRLTTNDATAKSVSCVETAGSCTFTLNVSATAEVEIRFMVWNANQ